MSEKDKVNRKISNFAITLPNGEVIVGSPMAWVHGSLLRHFNKKQQFANDRFNSFTPGFVDNHGEFLTLGEAYEVAESAGQLVSERNDRQLCSVVLDLTTLDHTEIIGSPFR